MRLIKKILISVLALVISLLIPFSLQLIGAYFTTLVNGPPSSVNATDPEVICVDIVTIEPVYVFDVDKDEDDATTILRIYDGPSSLNAAKLVCSAVTTEGESLWMFFYRQDYVKYIDPTSSQYFENYWKYNIQSYAETQSYGTMKLAPDAPLKEFSSPLRISGIIRNADDLQKRLSADIGQDTIIYFDSVVDAGIEE